MSKLESYGLIDILTVTTITIIWIIVYGFIPILINISWVPEVYLILLIQLGVEEVWMRIQEFPFGCNFRSL